MSMLVLLAPLTCVVVRYRLSYYPVETELQVKTVNADVEHGLTQDIPESDEKRSLHHTQVEISNVATSEPSRNESTHPSAGALDSPPTTAKTWKKLWTAEQFEGVYRGFLPACVALIFGKILITPAAPILQRPLMSDFARFLAPYIPLFYLPFMIITFRSIATSHKLSISRWKTNMALILTPAEIAPPSTSLSSRFPIPFLSRVPFSHLLNPFLSTPALAYLLSFILVNTLAHIASGVGEVGPLFDHFGDESPWQVFDHPRWDEWRKIGMYLFITALGTAVGTPLDVVITRLAAQPWNGRDEEVLPDEDENERSREKEVRSDGFRLTCDEIRYSSALDCFHRTIKEEGWTTLYRAWWLTMLGCWWPLLR